MKNKIINLIVVGLPLLIVSILNFNSANISAKYIEQKKIIMNDLQISEFNFSMFVFTLTLFIVLFSYIILKNILIVAYKFNNVEEYYLKGVAQINAAILILAPTVLSYIIRETIDFKNEYALYAAQILNLILFLTLYPKEKCVPYIKSNYYVSVIIYILVFIIPPIIIQKIA